MDFDNIIFLTGSIFIFGSWICEADIEGNLQVMRTLPRWTHRRYGLPQVAIHPRLSCHVTLGFSKHVVTVSVIIFSYDIEMGRS
jgi:hypothetical protein